MPQTICFTLRHFLFLYRKIFLNCEKITKNMLKKRRDVCQKIQKNERFFWIYKNFSSMILVEIRKKGTIE